MFVPTTKLNTFWNLLFFYEQALIYYYLHHYVLFNILLKQRGFLAYILGVILVLLVVTPIHNYFISFFSVVSELKLHPLGLKPNIYDDSNFALPLLVLVASFPLIVIIEWYKQANAIIALQQEKTNAELGLLKQQINPHFFFNTLNNLYAMSLKKAPETPETILKLSDLMRYVIYKGKEPTVSLKEEVNYIEDYVELHLIRTRKAVDVKFEKDIANERLKVPPLLFIILVENAFKHGVETLESDAILHISLTQTPAELTFSCVNNFDADTPKKAPGIGLQNLRKRLEILFPNSHQFTAKKIKNTYETTLKITL